MGKKIITLSNIKGPKRQERKRVGRGVGSTLGKTSGRGEKGQKARTGSRRKKSFEGGQMPITRRLPKFGFANIFKKKYHVIDISKLNILDATASITPDLLLLNNIIPNLKNKVRVLGNGKCEKSFKISGIYLTKGALNKLTAAGGKLEN